MPPPSVLQVGSAITVGSTQSLARRSLQPLRASLHISTATRAKISTHFSALLNNYTQSEHRSLRIIRRSAEVSNESKTEEEDDGASIAQGPDDDVPEEGQQFAQFAAGRFWSVVEAFLEAPGVTNMHVGYSQGHLHNPRCDLVRGGNTGHAEVVRIQYDPTQVSYDQLLDIFWECHDPTQKNRQGYFLGSQYRSGIYFYSPEQEKAARQSLERQQKKLDKKVVTEILPAKKFYRAEKILLRRHRWERRLLGGEKLSATSYNQPKLLAAKEHEDPEPKLPAAKEHEDPVKV
ncbi:peptide methionine sulfoxide reductase A1 [Cryptomeria japonica]|uniref:peptide methionine sulfoxide reductase A1 n=1 Tax=Cryptomeria japonica TaxID=3369 RepID=UPI0027DA5932|nr:peptide methionine sulfoxide reductase A1 [Cryptomeria japonica]